MNNIDKKMLADIADLHGVPAGSYNIRKNGKSIGRVSDTDVEIVSKTDKDGIDIIVKSGIKNRSVHIPVIVTESGLKDMVYNDFYIGDNAEVLIVAGCGVHTTGNAESGHDGIHTFHIGKGAKVRYIEKHLGAGTTAKKTLNPTTNIIMDRDSEFEMETIQIGGVTYSNRVTNAKLKSNAKLSIKEKILTTDSEEAITKFKVELLGEDSSVNVISRSVAKDNSKQKFVSKIIGKSSCFGHVECDGIILDHARIISIPEIDAADVNASLVHEAAIGKIAGEQMTKLMSLGLSETEAEDMIIKGYLS